MPRAGEQLAVPPLAPGLDAGLFRETLGRFATGVALITAGAEGAPLGLIANSLAAVSLSPPLMSFCPSRGSVTWPRMRRAGRFGVNLLRPEHEGFVRRAARPGADRFAGIDWRLTPSGVPRLGDALAFFDCAIEAEHPAGDHWIVVGRVEDAHIDPAGLPLVFWAGRFGRLGGEVEELRRADRQASSAQRKPMLPVEESGGRPWRAETR